MSKQVPVLDQYPSFHPPAHVPPHLILGVEPSALEQTLGQAHRHRRVVRPLARRQAKRSTADHVGDRLEGARLLELQGGPQRVPDREAEEGADVPIAKGDAHTTAANATTGSAMPKATVITAW
jgi:hypothetical protein